LEKKKTCAKRKKMPPAKHFAQAFLKLDAWFESTRGQGKIKGGKEKKELGKKRG